MELDDDAIFDKFIEEEQFSGSDGSDKENLRKSRSQKTTKEQYEKIVAFTHSKNKQIEFDNKQVTIVYCKVHSEELISTDELDLLWNNLTVELNSIGPPTHSMAEWKQLWSKHKYSEKRKRLLAKGALVIESTSSTGNLSCCNVHEVKCA